MSAYRCPSCGFWHLGHTSGRKRRPTPEQEIEAHSVSLFDNPESQGLHVIATLGYGRHTVALFRAMCDHSLVFAGYDYPHKNNRPFMGWTMAALTPVDRGSIVDFIGDNLGSLIDGDVDRALAFIEEARQVFDEE